MVLDRRGVWAERGAGGVCAQEEQLRQQLQEELGRKKAEVEEQHKEAVEEAEKGREEHG